jgi:hypothetical protein
VFYSQDKEGNVIAGSAPIMSLKLNEKSRFKVIKPKLNAEKQPVLLADGTPDFEEEVVNVNTLLGKQVDCSVVFNPRDLYHTRGIPIPQLYVRSCMILSITDSGDVEHGKSEMVRQFLQQNPDMLNTLAEQIAKLKSGQTSLLEVAKPKDTASAASAAPAPSSSSSSPVALPQAPVQAQPTQLNPQSSIRFAPQPQGMPMMPSVGGQSFQPQGQGQTLPTTQQGGIDLNSFLASQQQGLGQVTLTKL